jgi:hypothetical protein
MAYKATIYIIFFSILILDNKVMQSLSTGYIGQVMINLLIFLLLLAVYTYLIKLENIGCRCSAHPNKEFIKQFSLVALIYLSIIIFIPMSYVIKYFGTVIAGLFAFLTFVFYIMCIVYFYLTIDYTRYLVNEKCKCSEDIRRELILAGSIIEFSMIFLILLVIIILPIIFNSVSIIVKNMGNVEEEISTVVRNPYKSMRNIPSKLKKATNIVSKIGSQSKKGFGKMVKPMKSR